MSERLTQSNIEVPPGVTQILHSYIALERQIRFKEENSVEADEKTKRALAYNVYTRLFSLIDTVKKNSIIDKEIKVSRNENFETYFVTGKEYLDIGLRQAPREPFSFIVRVDKSKAIRLDPNDWCQDSQIVRKIAKGSLAHVKSKYQKLIIGSLETKTNLI